MIDPLPCIDPLGLTSEQAFFFSISPEKQCIAGLDGRVHQLNPAWKNSLTSDELGQPGSLVADLVPTEYREQTAELMSRVGRGECGNPLEMNVAPKGSDPIWIRWHVVANLAYQKIFITLYDFTEEHNAREAILGHQAFLRQVVDTAPNLIFAKNWDGHFTLANRATAEMYGTTPEGLVGKRDSDFNSDPEEVAYFLRDAREVMMSPNTSYLRTEPVTGADGVTRWYQSIKQALYTPDGMPKQMLGVATDITELKQAVEALRSASEDLELRVSERTAELAAVNAALEAKIAEHGRSQAELTSQQTFLRNVIDSAPIMIFVKDREGRYTLSNQFHADFFDTSVANLQNKTDADFGRNAADTQQYLRDDREVMDSGRTKFIPEEIVIDAMGNQRWFQTVKQPLVSSSGSVDHVLGVAIEITERKIGQEALRLKDLQLLHAAKLASLGTLAAGVAHELNQPLAIIRGVAQQILQNVALAEEDAEDLRLIEGQTRRMSKIINHLRTFSRKADVIAEEVDANEIARNCLTLIGQQLEVQGVQVCLNLCSRPCWIVADSNEVEQVLLNLVTNAKDALENRWEAQVTVSTFATSETVTIEVRDNGEGVPPEIEGEIFDPFFTTKEAGKGTGLGLSISHNILARYNGELSYRTDNGAVFTLTLPASRQDQAAA